ncbi:glycosyl transferase [Hanstruepera neustonica]|uniref:Glycosyl transferase n=1 Tax=Hanstruepera neustonica TaxID=1445657 RepID=A0A2K1DZ74_9FLAO|nr:glycosyltransferase family 2 protein [Hanstruepera neustonica]PNQ73321.1 glycosyl transferase [Hanstruepera neustonica]
MPKLSAVVITYNEAPNIDALIENLAFADEIVVIDSFSSDDTLQKLQNFKHIKTYQNTFKNFPNQKNFALSKATYDWVLFLDADERLTNELRDEILKEISKPNNPIVAYYGLFQYFFGKKPIKFSGFQSAKSFRLFKKSVCKYDESRPVHEHLIVKGKTEVLSNKILHYSFRSYDHYKEKMTQYAILKANKLHKQGKTANPLIKYIKIYYRFFNHYIMRLGILDGKVGYQISKLNAYEVKKRYDELKRLNKMSLSKK